MSADTEIDNFIRQTQDGQNRIRSFAFVISVCICALFSVVFISDFRTVEPPSRIELEGRINPNYAPQASLARLPGIGKVRAGAIIAYREKFRDNETRPFSDCNDLQKVKGIGPKTVENISEWLKFE